MSHEYWEGCFVTFLGPRLGVFWVKLAAFCYPSVQCAIQLLVMRISKPKPRPIERRIEGLKTQSETERAKVSQKGGGGTPKDTKRAP